MGVGSINEPARKVPSNVKDHGIVIAVAVVVGIRNLTEAGIEPGRSRALMDHQIARESIDVHAIGDVPNRIAIADDIVGVGSVVTDAGCKVVS